MQRDGAGLELGAQNPALIRASVCLCHSADIKNDLGECFKKLLKPQNYLSLLLKTCK